jgi:hypothetical protein
MLIITISDSNIRNVEFPRYPMYGKFHYISFPIVYAFLLLNLTVTSILMTYASNDPYDSGYDHGCDDAKILDPSDRYLNQPEKGPSFNTDTFMHGYYDGYNSCTGNTENIPLPEAETFTINAMIDFDRKAILEANGNNLVDAWFTIN